MLHIILLILKIIGIVLLSILGILILAIVCVMFVPVRYRIRVIREEGEDKPPVTAYIKITWLLHLVNILIRYPSKVIVRVRILIFTLFRIPGKEKKTNKTEKVRKSEKKEKTKQEKTHEEHKDTKPDESADIHQTDKMNSRTVSEERGAAVSTATEVPETEQGEFEEKKSLIAKIRNIIDKIKQIVEKIKAFFENIQYTIRKFCDKIKAASDNIQYYREVLESDPFRQSLQMCKGELGWVFRKLKPDKFEADLIVGMEDPAATGEILAICGMFYPIIGQHVRVVGDFACEKTHIEGRLYISGRMRVFTFLRTAIRIYFNKDIKKLIKLLKKEAV